MESKWAVNDQEHLISGQQLVKLRTDPSYTLNFQKTQELQYQAGRKAEVKFRERNCIF